MKNRKDITGQRSGKLLAIHPTTKDKQDAIIWRIKCDCGKYTFLTVSKFKRNKSCGCYKKGKTNPNHRHGLHGTPEYRSWSNMNHRGRDSKSLAAKNYLLRNITVCELWKGKEGFKNFLEDVGPRPSLNHSLDRIDNNGNYEPSNCRWATRTEQNNNSRQVRLLSFNGEIKSATEWARTIGIKVVTLLNRLNNHKWSLERAFTTPVKKRN